jgi:hypothetical protein
MEGSSHHSSVWLSSSRADYFNAKAKTRQLRQAADLVPYRALLERQPDQA